MKHISEKCSVLFQDWDRVKEVTMLLLLKAGPHTGAPANAMGKGVSI